ncbi:MAG: hypothetical protein H6596_02335 [Flavobacteriales bacterium]|nr:hypothetical protein [Flavobacteriales bacterium]
MEHGDEGDSVVVEGDSVEPEFGYYSPCFGPVSEAFFPFDSIVGGGWGRMGIKAMECAFIFDKSDRVRNDSLMETLEAIGKPTWFWKKKTLKVSFLNGNKEVQRRIRQTASKWEKKCAVRFDFGDHADPDIAISLVRGMGTWSKVGVLSRDDRKQGEASMNFDDLVPRSRERAYNQYVLHEFGHALGLIHEHQSPKAGIQWDTVAVYKHFKEKYKWSEERVWRNFFQSFSREQLNCSEFDPASIMIYAIHPNWTKDGKGVKRSSEISAMDAAFVARLFPKSVQRGKW